MVTDGRTRCTQQIPASCHVFRPDSGEARCGLEERRRGRSLSVLSIVVPAQAEKSGKACAQLNWQQICRYLNVYQCKKAEREGFEPSIGY